MQGADHHDLLDNDLSSREHIDIEMLLVLCLL
jgi:hypothetical protein